MTMRPQLRLSAVVTTFNNADTIEACLASLLFCDEIVVLDSGSNDGTRAIAERLGARVIVETFKGYSAQKQSAIDHASHEWIVLLDSDEWLDAEAQQAIRDALVRPIRAGYEFGRREWLFWRWQAVRSSHNRYLRLFDRRRARMSTQRVHERVVADGEVDRLDGILWHCGDRDIAAKVEKGNRYSSLQVEDRKNTKIAFLRLRMVAYPAFAFMRYYLLRGHWRAGWAGFIAAQLHAFYAFQKYAKIYEARLADRDH